MSASPTVLSFGIFELDLERRELRRRGVLVKLQAQPFEVLATLAARSGELVARREIQDRIWGRDTFVDFDQGLNACIRQVRQALGDSATSPRFVETVPRRGYRFLAPVSAQDRTTQSLAPQSLAPQSLASQSLAPQSLAPTTSAGAAAAGPRTAAAPAASPSRRRRALLAAAALLLGLATVMAGALRPRHERSPTPARAAAPAALLAVLPFDDYSPGGGEAYLGDGLTEELIAELSRRYGGRLGVIARTSSMRYKSSTLDVGEIARELGVEHVVEGSIRREGERLRVTAQLVRAGDGVHLWAGTYDRDLGDVLELQRELGMKIGHALALTLEIVPPAGPPPPATAVPAAYDAYLKGRHALHREPSTAGVLERETIEGAREHLEQAVRLDPRFAPAYVELAYAERLLREPHEGAALARRHLATALALDESLPQAHLRLAFLRFYHDWDRDAARRAFERALALDPGYAEAHHAIAAVHAVAGRHDLALAAVERALRLDPLSPGVGSDVGWYSYYARRHDDALEHSRRTLERHPGYLWAKECILLAAMAAGRPAAALDVARAELAAVGVPAVELAALDDPDPAVALAAYWRARLARELDPERPHPIPAYRLAVTQMALGRGEEALNALERAERERKGWILPFLGVDPLFDPLRGEPRFDALVERVTGAEVGS